MYKYMCIYTYIYIYVIQCNLKCVILCVYNIYIYVLFPFSSNFVYTEISSMRFAHSHMKAFKTLGVSIQHCARLAIAKESVGNNRNI